MDDAKKLKVIYLWIEENFCFNKKKPTLMGFFFIENYFGAGVVVVGLVSSGFGFVVVVDMILFL